MAALRHLISTVFDKLCSTSVHPPKEKVMALTRRATLIAMTALAAAPALSFGSSSGPSVDGRQALEVLRIGVIGAGWLGGTVGRCWVKAGHEVFFSTRHPEDLESWVKPLGPRASFGTVRQAVEFADILLLAVPYDAIPELAKSLSGLMQGKILLDACNPSASSRSEIAQEAMASSAAVTTSKYFPGVRVVRAFSAVDATSVEASFEKKGAPLGVPIASDDAAALQIASQLVLDAGCAPVVVGTLAQAVVFQRGGPGFRANTSEPELRRLLGL
jgi:predicted dinucleotide-binding enzyme